MADDLRFSIINEAKNLGISPSDLATVISYETGGTFDAWKKGPTTKWGEHRGLIQWGEPQRKQYGVYEGMDADEQMVAVGRYLNDAGVRPGASLMDIYSAINAGHVDLEDRSDAKVGGAPGTVADKVNFQMSAHKSKALAFLGGDMPAEIGAGLSAPQQHPLGTPTVGQENPYNAVSPPNPFNTAEQAAQSTDDKPYANLWQTGVAAAESDWAAVWALRALKGGAVDPDYSMDPHTFDEATKLLPETYHEYIANAHSEDDFQSRIKWAGEDAVREQKLAAGGWTATGVRLLTNIIDPTAIAATVATEGLGAPVMLGMKATRMGRILFEGTAAAAGNVAVEALGTTVNPKVEASDLWEAAGIGFVLGGTIGALRRNPHTQSEANDMAKVGAQLKNSSALVPPGSAGAMHDPNFRASLLDDAPVLDQNDITSAAFGGVRFDAGGQTGSSKSPVARLFSAFFGEEAVGKKDRSVVPDAATTVQANLHAVVTRDWQIVSDPAYKAWLKDTKTKKSERAWQDFNRQVADLAEEPITPADANAHVMRAVGQFRATMARYADLLSNPLHEKGGRSDPISELARDPNYVPKYSDHEGINRILETFDSETIHKFIKAAIESDKRIIDPTMIDRIARGWLSTITKAGYGMEDAIASAVTNGDREAMKSLFSKVLDGRGSPMSNDEVKRLFDDIDGLGTKKEGEGGFKNVKRRTFMDYTFKTTVLDKTGKQVELSMKDFFMRDADFVLQRYSRQVSGRIALAQMQVKHPKTGEMILDGIRKPGDFEKVLNWVRNEWATMPGGATQAAREKGANLDVANFKYMYDAITGTPHYNSREGVYKFMRRLREFNFIRLMNRMGIAQSQEFSRMFGSLGVKAMMTQMPALRRMIDTAGRSIPKNDRLLLDAETITGKGLEMDFGHHRFRYDDQLMGEVQSGKMGRTIDGFLETGKRFTANISLMTHVHSIQQKWAIKAILQRMYDMAGKTLDGAGHNLEKLKGKDLSKLRGLGMSDDELKLVFASLRQHSDASGSKLLGLNLDKWDPAMKARLTNTLTRWTDRIIHKNDAATLSRWMSQPVVQMMTQFRSFIIGSWAKSTLYNVHNFDARTFATMMIEVLAGTASWVLTQSAAGALRPDRDEFLKEKFTLHNLAKAGFSRAAFTSLIPAAVDTIATFTPAGPQFDFRTSGSATDFLFGNTTADLANSVATFTKGLGDAAISGKAMSQQQVQAGARSLPFANFLPFSAVLSYGISGLPKTTPKQ